MFRRTSRRDHRSAASGTRKLLGATAFLLSHVPQTRATVYPSTHELYEFDYLSVDIPARKADHSVTKRDNPIPLIVTNNCPDTIWPGIGTQNGDPPESQGFELPPRMSADLTVGPTWQGRVWGRTNCTTSGDTATCMTGDCFGKLDCQYGGQVPVTLAEFNLAGGYTGKQTFYDISLVDGYNLPLAIVYHPASNTTYIPPNLVSPACIGTPGYLQGDERTGLAYTNSSYPMPYETLVSNAALTNWCPWDFQAFPPVKPGDGVYPYPDDDIQRPTFDPCKSACAATNEPSDCCTGKFNDPNVCEPSQYSRNAKAVCPDAYSYAFDDQTSTFIIPNGGGFEVVFCPPGRSTNILQTFASELGSIANTGVATQEVIAKTMNQSYIESIRSTAAPTLKIASALHTVCFFATVFVGVLL